MVKISSTYHYPIAIQNDTESLHVCTERKTMKRYKNEYASLFFFSCKIILN